jgi:predicted membrane metal-binding protein
MSHGLAQLIGVSTACGLATAPVTWFQFHQISLVTVPANVVAVRSSSRCSASRC